MTADRVAALLIEHLKLPAPLSLVAESLNGHINFTRTSPLAQDVEMAQPTPTRRMNGQHTNSKAKKKEVTQLSPKSPLSSVKQPTNAQHQGIKSYSEAVAPPHAIEVAVVPRSVPRHFEFRTVPSNDPSLVDIEFELYQKYQVVHHGDDPSDATRRGFRRFLCDSPLRNAPASDYPPGAFALLFIVVSVIFTAIKDTYIINDVLIVLHPLQALHLPVVLALFISNTSWMVA